MMNKKRIGEYLKKLRTKKKKNDGKSFTQYDLANVFMSKYNSEISINAIAEWEKGSSLPTPENLEILAEIYNRTIDEILDAEDKDIVDYKERYFICDENWGMKFDGKTNLYQIRNEQIKLITGRFKEFVLTRIDRDFTANEEDEFRFLFNHFYLLSEYAKNKSKLEINDNYLIFKDAISELLVEIRNMKNDEQYWELQKLYSERNIIMFTFRLDVHELQFVKILQDRFKDIEDWQKDMLLAMFQNIEPFDENPSGYGAEFLKRYEENKGEYNLEKIRKSEIKELIKRGACINKCFLSIKKGYNENKRIIDRLEELYNQCLKPLEVQVLDGENDGKAKTYKIDNNSKNRFLKDYYFNLKIQLNGNDNSDHSYDDIDDIYNWFINNDGISDDIYLKIAEKEKVDTNREKKYWMADLKVRSQIDHWFYEFKEKERKIEEGLKEISKFKEMLESGDKEYIIHKYDIIGGNDEASIRDYIEYWKTELDYAEFLKGRDKKITSELLDEIDNLSMSEIKEKYFKMEVIENE